MKRIEDLIKYVIIIWIAYPVASLATYFSGNGRKLFGWAPGAVICAIITVLLVIVHIIAKNREKNGKSHDFTYEQFVGMLHQIKYTRLQYRDFKIEINYIDNEYICKIYQNKRIIKEKIFTDFQKLIEFPVIENKTIQELWKYSEVFIEC